MGSIGWVWVRYYANMYPMQSDEFEYWLTRAAQWSAHYRQTIDSRPVRSQVSPGDIRRQIDKEPPQKGESMETIFADFDAIIPPGMTHWQHPRFFAYFPSNSAPAAVVAEVLTTALSAQCMLWQTSPAATELEVCMIDWLRQATGLPDSFSGVLQDTASSSTLCAILTMREIASGFNTNRTGLFGHNVLRVYASEGTHSSIDKAMWIAGLGQENLVKVPTDEHYAMDVNALAQAINDDRQQGFTPAGIVVCVGGTSIGATDRVREICELARREGLYTHVDAAWAGSAMICPEYRHLWEGVELADSIVWNPHKWLGVPMECSAHFVRDPSLLIDTLSIQPAYLKTNQEDIVNFSEWSVQLGRRFRALKLWFLIRAYGIDGLQQRIRNHIKWSQQLAEQLQQENDFELTTAPILSLFSFRYTPQVIASIDKPNERAERLNQINRQLLEEINDDGDIYLTPSEHNGNYVIRFVAGQFDMQQQEIERAFTTITRVARSMNIE